LTLPGNNLSESDATFRNIRMDAIFTSPSGKNIRVPGFFAADGNAANSNATQGKIFKAYLRPDETGNWSYRVLYYTGNNVAISAVNSLPSPVHNLTGNIGAIAVSNKSIPDLRAKGRLLYNTTGTNSQRRYLQFAETGEYFYKIGPDSPENFLNYNQFDQDTPNVGGCGLCFEHNFNPHSSNFQTNDPTWDGGKGQNIIGAVNYISAQRMNSMSMSLFGGDDRDVYPWTGRNNRFTFDVSKLEQWEIVLNHAEQKGLVLHLKLAEAENWNDLNSNQIKTYYREMIARFGHHLGLEWNISEEYGFTGNGNQGADAQTAIERIDFLAATDGYNNPRVLHTYPGQHENKYNRLLQLNAKLTGASVQSPAINNGNRAYNGDAGILTWINNSKNANQPWVVASDEQNPGSTGVFTNANIGNSNVEVGARTLYLWRTLIAGGAGTMWYGGGQGDFRTENFNRFGQLFTWSRHAFDFLKNNNIPYWNMSNNDGLASGNNNYCLAQPGNTYIVYLLNGGSTNVNLGSQTGNYTVQWFNPRNGGALQNGNVTQIAGGANRSIGNPPNTGNSDWVALIRREGSAPPPTGDCSAAPTGFSSTGSTNTSVTLSIDNTTNDTRTFEVRPYLPGTFNGDVNVGALGFAAATAGSSTITVTGLDTGTTYDFVLRALCGPGIPASPTAIARASTSGTTTPPTGCTGVDYEEVNGLVVIEAENLNVSGSQWQIKTDKTGFTGAGHLEWTGNDFFNGAQAGNAGVITTKIRINDPGKYSFEWRNSIAPRGTSTTDLNDSWLRFPDAADFYGEKPNGDRTYPVGEPRGRTPNPEGASGNGYFKVYVNSLNWSFQSTTGDNADGRPIFVEFNAPGVYTMEIAARSEGHVIDRILLHKQVANAQNLSNPETPCSGGGTTIAVTGVNVTPASLSLEVGQTGSLSAAVAPNNASNKVVAWSSTNTSVAAVNTSGTVTAVAPGTATITATTADGGFTDTSAITVTNTAPPTGSISIGNTTTNNTGANVDGWNSNLVINESDTYTNTTGAAQTLNVDQFVFYANREADPVTPFIVKVNADNDFTILAVGTTRTSASYNVGENTLAFNVGTTKQITLANGETIATGFLDANANGSGGTIGSVIPFDQNAPADQIWYSGGPLSANSGSVVEGSEPTTGLNTITTLNRNYRFKINLSVNDGGTPPTGDCSAAPSGLTVSSATDTSVTFSFNNTANDTRTFELRSFPQGGFNGNINVGGISFAAAAAGSTSITIGGLQAGTAYDFVFRALCGPGIPASPFAPTVVATTSGGTTSLDCSAAPTGLTVTSATQTSVSLSFTNSANDTRTFELRSYVPGTFTGNVSVGAISFAAAAAGNSTITISGLQAGTTYDFVFRALCSGGTPGVSPTAIASGATTGGTTTTPQTVTLSATEDAYVQGTGGINNNTLRVQQGFRTSYIKFDVSSVTGPITSASLNLMVDTDNGSGTIEVNAGSSNNWSEATLNSSNAPSKGALLGSLNKTFGAQSLQNFTLSNVTLEGGFLTLIVSHAGGNDVSFKSSEATSGTPELSLTFNTNSIKTLAKENVVLAYPNPANNEIFINGLTKSSFISIFDISGRSIIKKMMSNQKNMRLDVSGFEAGIYFIKVSNGRQDQMIRFMKQ